MVPLSDPREDNRKRRLPDNNSTELQSQGFSHDSNNFFGTMDNGSQLRPPVTPEELWFRSKLGDSGRRTWDKIREKCDKYLPCLSDYTEVELQTDQFYLALTDVFIVLLSLAFLPMYFLYFEFTFTVVLSFLANRVAIPSVVLVARSSRQLRGHRIALLLTDAVTWYLCLGGLYGEVGTIISMAGRPMFDTRVQDIEEDMWGTQPAVEFSREVDIKIIGEYFHWCYFLFYGILFFPLPVFYWRYPRTHYLTLANTVLATLAVCAIIWVYFPVEGPYWALPHRHADQVGYLISHVVQWLVEMGSSHGTAFPSSHCGVSTATWIAVALTSGDYKIPFLLVTPGLWLATIYGGFHYCIDSICGILIGAVLAIAALYITPLWLNYFSSNNHSAPSSTISLNQVYEREDESRV
eukprot:CAMPEP_0196574020 /NCGR_PEP_ID=MMETSP1081-20130531/3814_1 /TAXON_ID=36882 /ORGANISM="Pyramimonas amylifera, Strain CCMP720" /LENGTH=407 /DNA_ID=CAMNT_0041891909 /DNA_START=179 /DNA_END=1402 /DNA_ORIENTATION=-